MFQTNPAFEIPRFKPTFHDAHWVNTPHASPPPPMPPPKAKGLNNIIIDSIAHIAFMLFLCYSNYYYFLPRFLKHKQWGRYLLEYLPVFCLSIILLIITKSYIGGEFLNFQDSFFFSPIFVFELSTSSLFIVIFITTLKFSENWIEAEAAKKELKYQHLMAELDVLKAQINPHFLFNTLNNLYALAYTNSPNTTKVIEKLSNIMRYMLQDCREKEVSLQKEISLLENFIDLEKIRLNHTQNIEFHADKIHIESFKIAPLILVTFLENAFKHGDKSENCSIKINLSIINQCLHYYVENRKSPTPIKEKTGIGLKNAIRQLDVYYKDKYQLDIQENDLIYSVKLIIQGYD